jgi:hypothetical protein
MVRIIAGVVIALGWVVFMAPSVAINVAHALNSGGHYADLILALAAVIATPICLTAMPSLARGRRFDLMIGASVVVALALPYSFSNAIGLAANSRDSQTEERAGEMSRVAGLKTTLSGMNADLDAARTRAHGATPEMVEGELIALKGDPVYTRSGACSNVTVEESRRHCSKISAAVIQKAAAEEVVRLSAEVKKLRARLDDIGAGPTSEDPKLDRIRALIGLVIALRDDGSRWVGISMDAMQALLVEVLGAFVPPIIAHLVWPARRKENAPVTTATADDSSSRPAITPAGPAAEVERPAMAGPAAIGPATMDGSPASDAAIIPATASDAVVVPPTISEFAARCLVKRRGSTIKGQDMFDAYVTDCHATGSEPENVSSFGIGMSALGWQKERKRVVTYCNVALKSRRPALVVAAE